MAGPRRAAPRPARTALEVIAEAAQCRCSHGQFDSSPAGPFACGDDRLHPAAE
jgi:hypothetical protein